MKYGWGRLIVLLLLLPASVYAQRPKSVAALIDRARMSIPNVPFSVSGKMTVDVQGRKYSGDYAYSQIDENHWREELNLPFYTEVRVASAPRLSVKRSAPAQPKVMSLLLDAIHPQRHLHIYSYETVQLLKKHKENGKSASCVRLSADKGTSAEDLCIDQSSGDLLSITAGEVLQIDYEYSSTTPHIPKLVLAKEPSESAKLELNSPSMGGRAPNLTLSPPVQEFGWCLNEVQGELIHVVSPKWPLLPHPRGTIAIDVAIENDGSVTPLGVVETAGKEFDAAALEAVKQWRFKPDSCDGEPIRAERVLTLY